MEKFLRFCLELIGLVVLGVIVLTGLAVVEQYVYRLLGVRNVSWSFAQVANLLLFYVIYRSKWQFPGWFKSEKNTNPLSKGLVSWLIGISILFLIVEAV
ncbi:hypothetical protein [Bacillus sp. V5-8f]|uniref:hypothetical protein n=1 Tax=Bacillus sp. V5-8f TaxID=2053044 RepID=UPI000C768838|nr:hypothetical protein [Bacillus sp. V5-8f]PLT33763.1 hypothetical protein CUU64_11650 [Bacillus sp. V5-8f]